MKKFSFLIMVAFLFSILTGCKNNANSKFQIVTSCYPVYIMALNIARDIEDVEVTNMCEKATGCLHNFQIRSEDLKKVEKSNAFVINGAGMESFLDKLLAELPKVKLIDSSVGIDVLENECDHHHEDGEEHDEHCHMEVNPHIWMSVENYIKQVQNISEGLCKIDQVHAEKYKSNASKYIEKLSSLKNDISKDLKTLKSKNIITFHEAFPYFAKEFGLDIVGVINHEPGEEPSMKEVKETIELIKEKNVKSIFVEPQYPESTARSIASETGAKVYTLDPAVTGDGSYDSYIDTMRKNSETLKEALS